MRAAKRRNRLLSKLAYGGSGRGASVTGLSGPSSWPKGPSRGSSSSSGTGTKNETAFAFARTNLLFATGALLFRRIGEVGPVRVAHRHFGRNDGFGREQLHVTGLR